MIDKTKNFSNYHFFYWGPLLLKMKLHPEDLKKCAKLCSKKSSLVNKTLAGVVKHEHALNSNQYYEILFPYLNSFRHGYENWYGRSLPKSMRLVTAWVNFMKAGEFNPPHIHANCEFSSVLFVKIPEKLKEENKKFEGTGGGPGTISFTYGEIQPYSSTHKYFFPEEGDLHIFPASLTHFVAPFMSRVERISISANFRID